MRAGISLSVTRFDLDRLRVLVKDRNAPQKHVWRAQIVLLSAEGVGTNAIMRASWLNAVEGFLAVVTKRRLNRGVLRSVTDLQAAINRFLHDHNAHSKPFQWVADPDKIIAAVRRGRQVLESIHEVRTISRAIAVMADHLNVSWR
jgi:hypothetical protein